MLWLIFPRLILPLYKSLTISIKTSLKSASSIISIITSYGIFNSVNWVVSVTGENLPCLPASLVTIVDLLIISIKRFLTASLPPFSLASVYSLDQFLFWFVAFSAYTCLAVSFNWALVSISFSLNSESFLASEITWSFFSFCSFK